MAEKCSCAASMLWRVQGQRRGGAIPQQMRVHGLSKQPPRQRYHAVVDEPLVCDRAVLSQPKARRACGTRKHRPKLLDVETKEWHQVIGQEELDRLSVLDLATGKDQAPRTIHLG